MSSVCRKKSGPLLLASLISLSQAHRALIQGCLPLTNQTRAANR